MLSETLTMIELMGEWFSIFILQYDFQVAQIGDSQCRYGEVDITLELVLLF